MSYAATFPPPPSKVAARDIPAAPPDVVRRHLPALGELGQGGCMADLVDLGLAGERLVAVAANVTDDQLDDPTPCEGRTVGQLVQHLVGLTLAFRAAA